MQNARTIALQYVFFELHPFEVCIYRKFPEYSDTQKIVVVTLKFELCGSTIE